MAYKSLLTVTTVPQQAAPAITAAARLAESMDAHLDALALGVDRTQVGYSYVGSGAVILQVAMERAEEEPARTRPPSRPHWPPRARPCAAAWRRP